MQVRFAALSSAALLAGCATAGGEAAVAPDYTPPAGDPAPRAKLYADCAGEAAQAGRNDRVRDGDTTMVRFTCTGAPAQAFYAALGPWSATRQSQWTAQGRTWRSTNRVQRNLFGVDYCSSDGAAAECVITLNGGAFLAQ